MRPTRTSNMITPIRLLRRNSTTRTLSNLRLPIYQIRRALFTYPIIHFSRRPCRTNPLNVLSREAAFFAPCVDPRTALFERSAELADLVKAELADGLGSWPAAAKGAVEGGHVEDAAWGVDAVPAVTTVAAYDLMATGTPARRESVILPNARETQAARSRFGSPRAHPVQQRCPELVWVAHKLPTDGEAALVSSWKNLHLSIYIGEIAVRGRIKHRPAVEGLLDSLILILQKPIPVVLAAQLSCRGLFPNNSLLAGNTRRTLILG